MFTANSISTGSDIVFVPSFRTSSMIRASGIMSYFMIPLNVRLLKPSSPEFSDRKPEGVMTETRPRVAVGQS